jgi:glycerophosphoryl diester phosphodiesterase
VDPAVVKDPIDGAKQIGATILSPGYTVPYGGKVGDPGFTLVADKKFVEKAHALGLKVIPWTINDAETMKAQIDAGADGIISDYPTILRKVLAEKGLALPPAYHR